MVADTKGDDVMMKQKTLCAMLIGFALLVSARASAVWWATEGTQIANNIELAMQYATQVSQLVTQIEQLADMINNSKTLPEYVWGQGLGALRQVESILKTSNTLSFASQDIEVRFAATHKDYGAYMQAHYGDRDMLARFVTWSKDSLELSKSTLQAIKSQADQFSTERAQIQGIADQSEKSRGRQESLQVGHQLSVQTLEQLQKLRQLMMMQLNFHANYMANREEREGAERATMEQFTAPIHVNTTDGKRF